MAEQAPTPPQSRDLNEIAEQTQPAALRLLDGAGLNALLRDLRQMKAAEQDLEAQKTLAQAIRRAAAEKRERQSAQPPTETGTGESFDKPGKAAKAEEKARKAAEQAERKRVKDAERAERKAVREAEKARLKAEKPGPVKAGGGKPGGKGAGGKGPGKKKADKG